MRKPKNDGPDPNSIAMSLPEFLAYYNKNIPSSFPQATMEHMEKFQADHAALFSGEKPWTIDKLRKKFMDWMVSRPKKTE